MTAAFMKGVKEGVFWLPKTEEIRLLNCADPPPKHMIANMLVDKMMNFPAQGEPFDSQIRRTAMKVKEAPPNKEWLLGMLSTFDNRNELFSKSYVKPKMDFRGNVMDDEDLVDNDEGFFDDLPPAKKVHKNGMVFGGNKEVAKQKKVRKLQQQMARLSAQMVRLADDNDHHIIEVVPIEVVSNQ